MSKNLVNCLGKLKTISKIKNSTKRKKALNLNYDECLYKALNEIAVNTVKRRVPLSIKQVNKLKKHKLNIKKLSCRTKNKKKQKQLVVQSGGFLPVLIPAIASILTSILSNQ